MLEYEDGRHQNATFYAGDDLFYDESGEELGNLTEIGCPTLTQELDNVSYNHSLIHLHSKILVKTIKLFSEIIPVFKICQAFVIRHSSSGVRHQAFVINRLSLGSCH